MAYPFHPAPPRTSILRRREVEIRTGLSRSTIYLRVSAGSFPQSINLGGRAVGWLEDEIELWLQQRITSSRKELK